MQKNKLSEEFVCTYKLYIPISTLTETKVFKFYGVFILRGRFYARSKKTGCI